METIVRPFLLQMGIMTSSGINRLFPQEKQIWAVSFGEISSGPPLPSTAS